MSSVSRTRPEAWWWGAMASAGGCAILAVTVSTQSWAEWFTHPAFGVFQDSWQNHVAGAKLLRVMLGVSCVAIGLYAVALRRLLRTQNPAPNAQNCAHKARSLEQWIVLSIVLVGMLLRMTRLGESLWYDEVASWLSYGVNVHSPGPIVGNYFDPVNHIFHTLLSWASVEAFSETLGFDLALRLPAFVFSVLTVVVMWGLGRSTQEPAARAQEEEVRGQRSAVSQEERAGEGRRSRRSSLQLFSQGESGFVGLIAAGLSAVLPVFVLEGAEARGYSQMMFFTALSTWMLVETWKRPCGWRWGVYVIANVLGVWSQFVTAFAAFGQTAWMTWRGVQCREWRRWWMGMTCLALAGILSVMVVSPVLPELRKEKEVFTSSRGDEPSVFGAEGQHALMQLGGAWYWWSALPGLVLVVAGVVGGRIQKPGDRRQEEDRPSPAPAKPGAPSPKGRGNEATAHRVSAREVGAMGLIGLLVFVAGISLAGSWMYARFVLFSLPGVVVVMASGIEWLWSRKIWMGVAACAVIAGVSCADLWARPAKQPLRGAMDVVRDGGGRSVVVIGVAHAVELAYAGDVEVTYSFQGGADVQRKLDETHAEWVIVEYPALVKNEVWKELRRRGFEEVKRLKGWVDWGRGDIAVENRKPNSQTTG